MMVRHFLGGILTPHPPVIVPAVGGGRERDAQATCDALQAMGRLVAELKPETLVLISPHAPVFRDFVFFYQPLKGETCLKGSLRQFGDTREHAWEWDGELQHRIVMALAKRRIEAGALEPVAMRRYDLEPTLDHGALVPLHFLSSPFSAFRLIVLASAGIDPQKLFELGGIIRDEAEALGRRILFIASGDLSHKVNAESPYGAVPEGERFDRKLIGLFKAQDLQGIPDIDHALREKAAECGFRSILTLCGALEGTGPKTHVHAYEAPFGIGYGVASFLTEAAHTEMLDVSDAVETSKMEPSNASEASEMPKAEPSDASDKVETPQTPSPHVLLARKTIETLLLDVRRLSVTEAAPPAELLDRRAGVFVTLHKFGDLRGCIGTIAPTTGSMAEEIIQNAISAAINDPRFDPVTADELPFLSVHVDVLNPAEPVASRADLDPKRYGVIVEKGMHRGLLLPDLEGVDTVAYQLEIACLKGGIDPAGDYRISRFTVTRHEA